MSKATSIPDSMPPDEVLQSLVNQLRRSLGHVSVVAGLLATPFEDLGDDISEVMSDKLVRWLEITNATLDEVDAYLQNRGSD